MVLILRRAFTLTINSSLLDGSLIKSKPSALTVTSLLVGPKNKIGQGNLFVISASLASSMFSTIINEGLITA